jgi:hypothetical protein
MASYATLNNNMQTQCGRQLRTFDRGMNLRVNVYVRGTGVTSYTTGANYYHRFEFVNASYSYYSNYLYGRIYTGQIIYDQDVIASINSVVRRTVDLIEGRFSARTVNAYLCHASCHSSCHSSRGRR